ncbi:MAG TPA: hypothetical protein VE956_20030 [Nodularia sp. (in: cyanobacteria)]|nr:hypothetical protein [Nodularia sp. (in: cyanobacteria)]
MDIEKQKLIEECAINYVLNDYGAAFGERVYVWEDWSTEDEDGETVVQITLYPPDDGESYTFNEVIEWDIQTSCIVEEDEDAQQYIVSVSLEKTEVSGDSTDENKETKETHYVTLHVFVEYEDGKFIAESAEEQ